MSRRALRFGAFQYVSLPLDTARYDTFGQNEAKVAVTRGTRCRGYPQPMDYLFSEGDMFALLEHLSSKLKEEIQSQDGDYILNVSETDLVGHFVEKYTLDVPVLHQDAIYVRDQDEAKIDVSGDSRRYFSTPGPHYMTGTRVTIAVPFSGDPNLFRYRPNQFTMNPPRAAVASGEVLLIYTGLDQTGEQIKAQYQADAGTISQWLDWVRAQAEQYNADLERTVQTLVTQRREKLLADRNLVQGLGLPIKPRPGEVKTYTIPDVRRKATVATPKPIATRQPYQPEPTLDESTFEEILGILRSMAHVIERSPSAFKTMGEEDLRQHFLVQLNGQYEGDATGETFNFDGKTDILIRRDGRNVFIAECKFWDGPRSVKKTIDQILGYLSWRDTKAAILFFVRNRNFSAVVDQIASLVAAHPNHKKTLSQVSETEFRFIFGQREDSNREIRLAVLLFPVPTS
jgi:hypothetical protein